METEFKILTARQRAEDRAMAYLAGKPSYYAADCFNSYVDGYLACNEEAKGLIREWFQVAFFAGAKKESFFVTVRKTIDYLEIETPDFLLKEDSNANRT